MPASASSTRRATPRQNSRMAFDSTPLTLDIYFMYGAAPAPPSAWMGRLWNLVQRRKAKLERNL